MRDGTRTEKTPDKNRSWSRPRNSRETEGHVFYYGVLGLSRTPISKACLGALGAREWGRMTVNVLEEVAHSYTLRTPAAWLATVATKVVGMYPWYLSGQMSRVRQE